MNAGMLWFDNDPKMDLISKIKRAVDYYQKKYGIEPNACFVHPSMLSDPKIEAGAVRVCANHTVLPNHFWIGYQETPLAT